MSAIKRALHECIEKLVADQGYPFTDDMYFVIWELFNEEIIAPVDFSGEQWIRDGKIFASTDKELLA